MSTKTLPGFEPASAPSDPSRTSRTSLGKPTIEKITSEAAATARGVSAHFAPWASSGSALDFVRLYAVTGKPALSRWPAMLMPITPVPIQPNFVSPGLICGTAIVAPNQGQTRQYIWRNLRSHPSPAITDSVLFADAAPRPAGN